MAACGRCFSVLWCNSSNKKHKTWDGDGFLEIFGTTAILRDEVSGKQLAKSSGHHPTVLEGLKPGSIFIFSGKEAELQEELSIEDYTKKFAAHSTQKSQHLLSDVAMCGEISVLPSQEKDVNSYSVKLDTTAKFSNSFSRVIGGDSFASDQKDIDEGYRMNDIFMKATQESNKTSYHLAGGSHKMRPSPKIIREPIVPLDIVLDKAEGEPLLSKDYDFKDKSSSICRKRPLSQLNQIQKFQKFSASNDYIEIDPFRPHVSSNCHYFSVLYSNWSTRKHKKWDGDGILTIDDISAVLYDEETGRPIAKSAGYNDKQYEQLENGSLLIVGSKEVEVQNEISFEEYEMKSKKFTVVQSEVSLKAPLKKFSDVLFSDCNAEISENDSDMASCTKAVKKAFVNPFKDGATDINQLPLFIKPRKPLYSVSDSKAVVISLAEPNDDNSPAEDVVVDPYIGRHLRPHQIEGLTFLYECVMGMKKISQSILDDTYCSRDTDDPEDVYTINGAILADEMGLGKSLQAIALIWTLLKQKLCGRSVVKKCVIVCPSSLTQNWKAEFKKWLGDERLRPIVMQKPLDVKLFANTSTPVLILSYEMLLRCHEVLKEIKVDLLICDEGHRLKNSEIKTNNVLSSFEIQRRVLLTGTPVQNDLKELFALCDFVNPGILGTPACFRRNVEEPITNGQMADSTEEEKLLSKETSDKLKNITKLFLLRRGQEVNEKYLPCKTDYVVFCRPSLLQLRLCQKLINSRLLRKMLSKWHNSNAPPFACIDILRKICNHPVILYHSAKDRQDYEYNDYFIGDQQSLYEELLAEFPAEFSPDSVNVENSGKLAVLCGIMTSVREFFPGQKIVVVSNFTQTLNLLENMIEAMGFSFCRLDGSTPSNKRQEIVHRFNSKFDKTDVFLLSSKAGGVGFNLIGANRLILYDSDWNPANDIQALARIWRDGQKLPVHVYRLITAGTIDEKIYQRQVKKQKLNEVIDQPQQKETVELSDEKIQSVQFSIEDLRDIFTIQENCICQTHQLIGCKCLSSDESCPINEDVEGNNLAAPEKVGRTTIGELLNWEHKIPPIASEKWQEGCLEGNDKWITMIFRHFTDTQTLI